MNCMNKTRKQPRTNNRRQALAVQILPTLTALVEVVNQLLTLLGQSNSN